jgi:hypothetical protein
MYSIESPRICPQIRDKAALAASKTGGGCASPQLASEVYSTRASSEVMRRTPRRKGLRQMIFAAANASSCAASRPNSA